MLLDLIIESLICFGCVLSFLLLFEIPLIFQRGKGRAKFSWLHFALNLIFVCLLAFMLDLAGIPNIWSISKYGVMTQNRLHILVGTGNINLIPFHYFAASLRPYLENILFFAPFGFLLPLLWERYSSLWRTVSCGFLFSFVIEFSQLFSGRVADIDDLLMNTLGAFAGWLLWLLLQKCLFRICGKVTISKKHEKQAFLLRHEALFDILAAFMGMFFLYNPCLSSHIPYFF